MADGKWLAAAKRLKAELSERENEVKSALENLSLWAADLVGKEYKAGDTTLYLGVIYRAKTDSQKRILDTPLGSEAWEPLRWWKKEDE